MSYGDVGGAVTELIITCKTESEGIVDIVKGDAVRLSGEYTIDNGVSGSFYGAVPIFGECLMATCENCVAVPVKVRGISIFKYIGFPPLVDGKSGVWISPMKGFVEAGAQGEGTGINLKVDEVTNEVHVLT